jgi:hypothetical protein
LSPIVSHRVAQYFTNGSFDFRMAQIRNSFAVRARYFFRSSVF